MRKYGQAIFIAGLLISMLLLAGCSSPEDTPTVHAATDEQEGEEVTDALVTATGRVVPAQWTLLSFQQLGIMTRLLVEEGDRVNASDIIAELDTATLEAALKQAEAGLAQAEANLARVSAGPSEQEIRAAELAVDAANARIGAAAAGLNALYSAITEADILAAQGQLLEAQLRQNQAREQLDEILSTDPEDCENIDIPASVTLDDLTPEARKALADFLGIAESDLSDLDLASASGDVETDEDLDIYVDQQRDYFCPLSYREEVSNYVELAGMGVAAAQAYLSLLERGPSAEQVMVQNAQIWLATTQVATVQARLDYLLALPFAEDIAIAEAQVTGAEAEVQAAQVSLEQAALAAPFAGTITMVLADAGELVAPGQPVVQLGDLNSLRIETLDLNEIDVTKIQVGNSVLITFDALPDLEISGRVIRIDPRTQDGAGANYTVVIEMEHVPDTLRWGMTASIAVVTNQ